MTASEDIPKVKSEPICIKDETSEDENPEIGAPDSNDDFDEEVEGILAEYEDAKYYEDNGFKIKQVPTPTIVQRTLGDLYRLSKTPYLKLDPEYQREVVWDEGRASALIASALQGYFIPPIIFKVDDKIESDDSNSRKIVRHYRICVDGKQRLSSVQKFMQGEIGVLDSSHPPKKWYYCHPYVNGIEKTSNHHILPDSTKEFFCSRMFCCYEYSGMPALVEETMFQLVQRGIPLTPAERMRALSTNWAHFGKQYEEDYAKAINLSKQSRASGFRSVITIFCQVMEVMQPSISKRAMRDGGVVKPVLQSSPQVLTKLLIDDQSLNEAVKAKLKKVFDKFLRLADLSTRPSPRASLGFVVIPNSAFDPAPEFLKEAHVGHVKTFSPLELVATSILLLMHMETRTDTDLIGDIKEMRIYLREKHKDLRLNNQCWITAWEFIDSELIKRDGSGAAARKRHGGRSRTEEVIIVNSDEDYANYNSGPDPEILSLGPARELAIAAIKTATEFTGYTRPVSPPVHIQGSAMFDLREYVASPAHQSAVARQFSSGTLESTASNTIASKTIVSTISRNQGGDIGCHISKPSSNLRKRNHGPRDAPGLNKKSRRAP